MQEEAQTATQLEGVVSKETQLSVLSIVPNVSEEIERMKEEQKASEDSAVERFMFTRQTTETKEETTEE